MSHCAFPTPDIKKTANFYEQKMGFPLSTDATVLWSKRCL
ncbi:MULTISPECIES: VOC family protein [Cytobacillus]|nr:MULTISPECIES: VOC family protein [Cytobacillus]